MHYQYTCMLFFFFNDTATTEIYTLSLHDALPISEMGERVLADIQKELGLAKLDIKYQRSEEHTSELQSLTNLVCRLLLEKKKKNNANSINNGSSTNTNVAF